MWRGVAHIEEEGTLIPTVLVQIAEGVIREGVRRVEILVFGRVGLDDSVVDGEGGIVAGRLLAGLLFAGAFQPRVEEVAASVDEAVVAVEPSLDGQIG